MKEYFAYTRVSTAKQGEGVSLQEQRSAIEKYAKQHEIGINSWFEEKETAAKRGRNQFNRMLKLLRSSKASGVIIHKIDRSARNLRDWADLGELLDSGIDVRFAHENLDLSSRGGRLSADLQAVVAADYIRNLREETKKGIYGRLKQGIYPLPAPIGYRDTGAGKPKEIDPVMGPLVRQAFEHYATGQYSVRILAKRMHGIGLRSRGNKRLSRNAWCNMLSNPFYLGLIRIKKTGEVFDGAQVPLIKRATFDRVQNVLHGKAAGRKVRHDYLLRRRLRCVGCNYSLIGERQKGRVYYRCQKRDCPTTTIREDRAEDRILDEFEPLFLSPEELAVARKKVAELERNSENEQEKLLRSFELSLAQIEDRLNRLTDAYLDSVLDRETFEQRKKALLLEKKDLEERREEFQKNGSAVPDRVREFLELAESAWLGYKLGEPEEKRDLLEKLTSNRFVSPKNLMVELKKPFDLIANRQKVADGAPRRATDRTISTLVAQLFAFAKREASTKVKWWADKPIPLELRLRSRL